MDHNQFPPENIYGHTKKLRFLVERIRLRVAQQGTVRLLDFGCGNGTAVSQYLRLPGVEYCGVDFHEPSLAYARTHFGGERAEFHSEIPPGRLFDIIVYADVLEHVPAPGELMCQHGAVLADDGMILGSVPNGYGPFENEKRLERWLRVRETVLLGVRLKRWLLRRPPLPPSESSNKIGGVPYNAENGHVQFFTKRQLRAAFREAGLQIDEFRNGAFVGAPLSEEFLLSGPQIARVNARIADLLPYWAVSTWYFTARPAMSEKRQSGGSAAPHGSYKIPAAA